MDTLLTAKQVEELLNVDRTTVYRMIKDGRLTGVKIGQHWRFSLQDVEELLSSESRVEIKPQPVSRDVLPLHCMQPVQDVFGEIAQVGAVTADCEGQPLTRISNACDFCKLILGSPDGRQACMDSWRRLAQQAGDAPEFTTCHAGLQYARAKITVNGDLLAILIAGQFYVTAPDPEEEEERIRALAQKFNIDPQLLQLAARKITVLDGRNIPQMSRWLERVAGTFEQISSERADLMQRLKQIAAMSDI